MEDKDIVKRAQQYVQAYREGLDAVSQARTINRKHPMLLVFLGVDDNVFNMEECRTSVERSVGSFWLNHADIAFVDIDINNTANTEAILSEACEKVRMDQSASDSNLVDVGIITLARSKTASHLKNIISTVYKNLSLDYPGINFTVYASYITGNANLVNELSEFITAVKSLMNAGAYTIKTLLFGDKLNVTNKPIPANYIYESIASNLILLNNDSDLGGGNVEQIIENKEITLTGFSKTDIPLETVYIVGFDAFSDRIIEVLKKGKVEVTPEYGFSIEKDILKEFVEALRGDMQRLGQNAKYLIRNGELGEGNYSIDQINNEFKGNLDLYIDLNIKKDFKVPDDSEIIQAFDAYISDYFLKYGLIKTQELVKTIVTKEELAAKSTLTHASGFYFGPSEENITQFFEKYAQIRMNKMIAHARRIILEYIGSDAFFLNRVILKTLTEIENSTERCKQETITRDSEINNELAKRYSDIVSRNNAQIEKIVKSGELNLDFENKKAFEESIFSFFEKSIVKSVLFDKMGNYEDDVKNMSYADAKNWLNKQLSKADLSMKVTNNTQTEDLIIMTDMDLDAANAAGHSKVASILINQETEQFNIFQVKGIPVFRCLKYKKINNADDLFCIQRLKEIQNAN